MSAESVNNQKMKEGSAISFHIQTVQGDITTIGEQESPFTLMAEEYGASKVIYSHCHGKARFDDSFKGYVNGIEYKLVSGDYLGFKPELILQ